jgi:hypothetical protein
MGVNMTIFKITKKHTLEYEELEHNDVGLYAVKIADDKEVMVYETKAVAQKALEYFQKSFNRR